MSQNKKKNKVGRPLKFKTPEELQRKIDKYFENCRTEKRPFTITGLALALDANRETLLNYEERDEFFGAVKKAKLMCQNYAEECLFTARQVAGTIFNLKNNYGWKDTQDISHSGEMNIITWSELLARAKKVIKNKNGKISKSS